MTTLLILAGLAQLGLALVSLGVPRVLRWREELRALSPLNRHIFWVYAAYILLTNVAFGVLTLVWSSEIARGDGLAAGFAAFVAVYWLLRFAIQFAVFARPPGAWFTVAHWVFAALFAFLGAVYAAAAGVAG